MFLAAVTLGNKICSVRFGIGKCSPFSIYKKKKNVLISTFLILLVFDCEFFPFLCFSLILQGLGFFYFSAVSYARSGVMNSYFTPKNSLL